MATASARPEPADVVDLFVYVVVLNLAIEYLPRVISENFTLSLLTALLLKVALELVLLLKGRILTRLRAATTPRGKAAFGALLWVVAAGSKLVVLGLVDLVFGSSVSLGGFVSVTVLVVALLLSRSAVRRLLDLAAAPSPEPAAGGGSFGSMTYLTAGVLLAALVVVAVVLLVRRSVTTGALGQYVVPYAEPSTGAVELVGGGVWAWGVRASPPLVRLHVGAGRGPDRAEQRGLVVPHPEPVRAPCGTALGRPGRPGRSAAGPCGSA